MALRWKDVVAITKEKTALVIPNAIQLCTENDERHFFTSFAARDRSYMMLFKLWQNALLDQVNDPLAFNPISDLPCFFIVIIISIIISNDNFSCSRRHHQKYGGGYILCMATNWD